MSSDEDLEEWRPPEPKAPSKTARDPAARVKKAAAKRTAKPRVPKEPKVSQGPKPSVSQKPAAKPKTAAPKRKNLGVSASIGTKKKQTDENLGENNNKTETGDLEEGNVDKSDSGIRMKEEVSLFTILAKVYMLFLICDYIYKHMQHLDLLGVYFITIKTHTLMS